MIDPISPCSPHHCLAVILAGGQGKRLGGISKNLISIRGKSILQRQLDVTQFLAHKTVLIGKANALPVLPKNIPNHHVQNFEVWTDLYDQSSPLSGIRTALLLSPVPWVWVFAGDMPWITVESCQNIVQHTVQYYKQHSTFPCITFYQDQHIHPLAALWHKHAFSYLPPINERHPPLKDLCKNMPHLSLSAPPPPVLYNINTREDLQKATAFFIDT